VHGHTPVPHPDFHDNRDRRHADSGVVRLCPTRKRRHILLPLLLDYHSRPASDR
jgi:hypothetical protein